MKHTLLIKAPYASFNRKKYLLSCAVEQENIHFVKTQPTGCPKKSIAVFGGSGGTQVFARQLNRYMANMHQDGSSIRNMQMVSSNRVHSTHSCEANKCPIFKLFFCSSDKRCLMLIIKKKVEEDKSQGAFFSA